MQNACGLSKELPVLGGKHCAVIVAHPDDETLWAGGVILMHPEARWEIITLCRGSDTDRAPKFATVLDIYCADGAMGDLDDGPEQKSLHLVQIEQTILGLLGDQHFDLIITHSPAGEYTCHRRHEEAARAVLALLESNRLQTGELWMFAYNDNNRREFPKPIGAADVKVELSQEIWKKKYNVITTIYGFSAESWEARTTPKTEAFWTFRSPEGVEEKIRARSSKQ